MTIRDMSKATRAALEALALDVIEQRDPAGSLAWLDTQTLRPEAEAKAEARRSLQDVRSKFPESRDAVDAALATLGPEPTPDPREAGAEANTRTQLDVRTDR